MLLLDLITTLILLSSVHAISDSRRQFFTAAAVVLPAIVVLWGAHFSEAVPDEIAAAFQTVAMTYVAWHILVYVLRPGRVDTEKIYAAICVYFFIGVVWKNFYLLVDQLIPGSFGPTELARGSLLYFSFITLSTLGYGDITPANGPAQALAYLEALTGQLYLTILVARLVGLHIAEGGKDNS
jgi:hypothetical protein